jgi:hypothetical protein
VRRLALALLAAAVLAAPGTAEAGYYYLGAGEAARIAGKTLHREYNNVAQGSLNADCPATGNRSFRRCFYTYYDDADKCWGGSMGVRQTGADNYRYRITYDELCSVYH